MIGDDPTRKDLKDVLARLESGTTEVPPLPEDESMYGDNRELIGFDADRDGPDAYVHFEDGRLFRVDHFVERWTGEIEGESYESVMDDDWSA